MTELPIIHQYSVEALQNIYRNKTWSPTFLAYSLDEQTNNNDSIIFNTHKIISHLRITSTNYISD